MRKYHLREAWLNEFIEIISDDFKEKGYELPKDKIHVSCGFPIGSRKIIGQCFSSIASKDGFHEIFISPTIEDSIKVGDILIHELCHVAVGVRNQHNKMFKQCAIALGLEGKVTATYASEELEDSISQIIEKELGEYPHSTVTPQEKEKKQTTRLIKVSCPICDYTIRLAKKWIEVAIPNCPNPTCERQHEEMEAD